MKKVTLVLLIIFSFVFAEIKIQGQATTKGNGIGLGIGKSIIPMFLSVGLEADSNQSGAIDSSKTIDSITYEGSFTVQTTSVGGYIALSFPGISLIPVVGMFASPIIHVGSITGTVAADIDAGGGIPFFGTTSVIGDDVSISGGYVRLGLPFYIGPLFLEPSFGSDTLVVNGLGTFPLPSAQIAVGIKF